MKTLVIYYSFEGNTKYIAESIAAAIDADLLELKPEKEMKSRGFMKFVWGGRSALMKSAPELVPLDKDPGQYDCLLIGTPVWAWTYTPPLNTFFQQYSVSGKKVGLFCCHGGGPGKIFEKMKSALGEGIQFVGEIDFFEPLKKDPKHALERATEWAKSMEHVNKK